MNETTLRYMMMTVTISIDGDNVEMIFRELIIIFDIDVGIHLYPSLAS